MLLFSKEDTEMNIKEMTLGELVNACKASDLVIESIKGKIAVPTDYDNVMKEVNPVLSSKLRIINEMKERLLDIK